jgi:hypothetical protein
VLFSSPSFFHNQRSTQQPGNAGAAASMSIKQQSELEKQEIFFSRRISE